MGCRLQWSESGYQKSKDELGTQGFKEQTQKLDVVRLQPSGIRLSFLHFGFTALKTG